MRKPLFIVALAAIVLAGCQAEEGQPDHEPSTQAAAVPQSARAHVRPALTAEEMAGQRLEGELGCSFVEDGAEGPLLVAMADVLDTARADGVMKLGPATLRLRGAEAGGFNAMVRGATFTSGDLTARVAATSSTPAGEGEAPPFPAVLEITTSALGTQTIAGQWSCGP